MLRFLFSRLAVLIPTFLGVSIVAFSFIRLLPGDPVMLLSGERVMSPERHAQISHDLGYDRPLVVQYGNYIWNALHGDLGTSITTKRDVLTDFLTFFPATLELSICAMILAICLGIPAGVFAAVKRGHMVRSERDGCGPCRLFHADLLVGLAADHRLQRLSALDAGFRPYRAYLFLQADHRLHADRQPFVRPEGRLCFRAQLADPADCRTRHHSARRDRAADAFGHAGSAGRGLCPHRPLKGLAPLRVVSVHALRNAMIPVVTTIGLQVGVLLGGAILTESIFSWPGIGKWMIDAVFKRDYPVVQGGLLLIARHCHARQSRRRPALRLHQSTHSSLGAAHASTVSLKSDRPSALAEFWYYFSRNKGAVIGLAVFVFVLFLAIFAGVVAPHDPDAAYGSAMQRLPPVWAEGSNSSFLLGTDANGRDLLSRLIYGTRFSLFIGLVVASLSALAGILIGLVAGYVRGRTDTIIMRVMDIILAIPSLLLALVLVAILGPGLTNAMIAISIVNQPHFVRLTRASVMAERDKEYVIASRVSGAGPLRLMFKTILPNCLGAADRAGDARLLGRDPRCRRSRLSRPGAQPPTPEWGTMLADLREFFQSNPWLVTFPGLCILITVLAINLMGDGLRDAFDPKLKRS